MDKEKLRAIFVDIRTGKNPHGDFITYFANCFLQADAQNRELLFYVACEIVRKYQLDVEYEKNKKEQ